MARWPVSKVSANIKFQEIQAKAKTRGMAKAKAKARGAPKARAKASAKAKAKSTKMTAEQKKLKSKKDTAYHKARLAAIKAGLDAEEAKIRGSEVP